MKNVEQLKPGFQWAEPLQGQDLDVEWVGFDLQITGLVPSYEVGDSLCDLIHQFKKTPEQTAQGHKPGTQSPEVSFANADTDEKLIAFVRRFGPVAAKWIKDTRLMLHKELDGPRWPGRLIACQDMQELRNEQTIYRAALALVMQLGQPQYDFNSAQQLIKTIAAKVKDWPRQREREWSLRQIQPKWELSAKSLERIEQMSSSRPDSILPHQVDGRIVICELLNSFPLLAFPNPLEMHSSIRFGIRPLLYSLLMRQFFHARSFAICANTVCRNFFNLERGGQQFCSADCSLQHRQRVYWEKRGKKLRKKRTAQRRKMGK